MEKILLKRGKATAEIQTKGAQIASYRTEEGREVIWQADPAVWPQHAPVLFPVCGKVTDDRIMMNGKTYPMTKHGFSQNAEFNVVRKGADFAELALSSTEESRPMYPFDFTFTVAYTLTEDGYRTTFRVENRSKEIMPFCTGGHPAFICPMEEDTAFEDYELIFPEKEDGWNALVASDGRLDGGETLACLRGEGRIPLRYDWFDTRDTLVLTHLKSRSVKLVHRTSGKGLRLDFPKLEVLAVWTMPKAHAKYVCLEPWHGIPDTVDASGRFEDKSFATLLKPGETWEASFVVTLLN